MLGHLNSVQTEDEVHGIALAVEAINADPAQHVAGRKIKVIHADAGTTPEEVQGQTVRLLTVDKVEGLIGTSRWSQTEKLSLANQSPNVVAISLNGYAGVPAGPSLFPVGISPAEQGKTLARHAKETLKSNKAVIVKEADAIVPGLVARSFAEQFGNGPGEHSIKAGDSLDLLKEFGAKADVILLCGSAKQVNLWRSKLPTGPRLIFGGEEADIAELAAESDPSKSMIAAVSFHVADETPAAKEFVRRFQEKFSKPPTVSAALAYDAIRVWAEAARRANSAQADRIREQLTKNDASFEVLSGTLSFTDQAPRRSVFIVQLTEGAKFVRRYEP